MDTRERIITAAITLLSERGYAATTTRAIAQQAGVNEVTLFRHFGSKQGVLAAIGERFALSDQPYGIEPGVPDIRAALQAAGRTEVDQVVALGAFAVRIALDAGHDPDVAAAFASPVGPQSNLAHLAALFEAWQDAGRIRDDVEPRLLADSFSAQTSGLLISRLVLGGSLGPDPAGDIARLVDLFCDALDLEE